MTQPADITPVAGGAASPVRMAGDLLGAIRYWADNTLGDLGTTARLRAAARLDLLRGRPEQALLRYGHAIRHVKLARQSLATYTAVDRLVRRYPEVLADYSVPEARPERFVFFVGYSRSGHSLVGSLLDAHPNALVSHELHAMRLFRRGAGFAEVVRAVQYNSSFFTRLGRGYSGYDYRVDSQSQGTSSALKVIGDNKANGTTAVLRRDPTFAERLRERLPVPFSFVHVIRNPYDNIATRAKRVGTGAALASYGYFVNVDVVARLRREHPDLVHDLHLDDLTAAPAATLERLLRAVGIGDVPKGYLADCAGIVFPQTRRTQDDIAWPEGLKDSIRDRLGRYDFLARYAGTD